MSYLKSKSFLHEFAIKGKTFIFFPIDRIVANIIHYVYNFLNRILDVL